MGGERARRLRQALEVRVRAAWQDLFGDAAGGSGLASGAWDDEAQALLAAAEARLEELRQGWAAALARAHQAQAAWQTAGRAAERLDTAVNEALVAQQEHVARERQRELNLGQQRLETLEQRRRSEADLAGALAAAIQRLETEIRAARDPSAAGPGRRQTLRQTLARLAEAAGDGKDTLA